MILDDLASQIGKTLISELQAITQDGNIDHKSRLLALKEARSFLNSLLPKLTKEDRERFSKNLTDEMTRKMNIIIEQEKTLESIRPESEPNPQSP